MRKSFSFGVLVLVAGALSTTSAANGLCSPAPKTGCFQSERVRFTAKKHAADSDRDILKWLWKKGEAVLPADLGTPAGSTSYALCVYDGATTMQDEIFAPTADTNSLVLDLDVPLGASWSELGAGKLKYRDPAAASDGVRSLLLKHGAEGKSQVKLSGKGPGLGLAALDAIDRSTAISQLQNDEGGCWSAAFGVTYDNGPDFFDEGGRLLDEDGAEPLLDELAALFNAKHGGPPLNMTLWISGVAAAEIVNMIATTPPNKLDTRALFSALHVAGWYGGMWFQRDGFLFAAGGEPCDPGVDLFGCSSCGGEPGCPPEGGIRGLPSQGAFNGAVAAYRQGLDAQKISDAELLDNYLTAENINPGAFDGATGLRSVVSLFGYNAGYGLSVVEDNAAVYMPDPDTLVCAGTHPPFPAVADGELLNCTYQPGFLDALPSLRHFRDEYIAAFPVKAQEYKQFQDEEEGRGRLIWFFLTNIILQDADVRKALWDVDNAFLETLNAAGLMTMGALANSDADLGRQAALATAAVKGWLGSYQFGLPAPEPRVLPRWDLGTTPIRP
jgi:hypothetical protein